MKAHASVHGGQNIARRLADIKAKMESASVAVGLPSDAGTHPEAGMSYARLGAVHEFGATIQHPGGTRYVIGSDGKAHFVSNDYMGPVSGVTAPHTIDIPERSFLRVPLRANQDKISSDFKRLLKKVLDEKMTMSQALNQIGARGASISQEAISSGLSPANASSTVRQKGSSTPLMNSGALRRAITWVVEDKAET